MKWFQSTRMHSGARIFELTLVQPRSHRMKEEAEDVKVQTAELPELGRPSRACWCGRRLHCRAEGER